MQHPTETVPMMLTFVILSVSIQSIVLGLGATALRKTELEVKHPLVRQGDWQEVRQLAYSLESVIGVCILPDGIL